MAFTIEDEILTHKSLHDMSKYDYAMKVKFVNIDNRVRINIDFVDKNDNVILSKYNTLQFYIYTFLSDLSKALKKSYYKVSLNDVLYRELEAIDDLVELYRNDIVKFTYNFDYNDSIHDIKELGKLCVSYVIVNDQNEFLNTEPNDHYDYLRESNFRVLDLLTNYE